MRAAGRNHLPRDGEPAVKRPAETTIPAMLEASARWTAPEGRWHLQVRTLRSKSRVHYDAVVVLRRCSGVGSRI
jgi:hypothetical protein